MKTRLTRLAALLLAALMIVLAGCGGGGKKTLSKAVEDTLGMGKATFEMEIDISDMPVSTSGISGIKLEGVIDQSTYDFTADISLSKKKGGSSEAPAYGMSAILQTLLNTKGSIMTVGMVDGYLCVDFSSLIKAFGNDLVDVIFNIALSSSGVDYEDVADAISDAKLDEYDRIIALVTYAQSPYYYDDIDEVLEEMEDYADEIDEIRDVIADIEGAAGVKLSDLVKATGVKIEIGKLSKDAQAAIKNIQKVLVDMVKAAEEADKEFVVVDKKNNSFSWTIDSKNAETVLEPALEVLTDKFDDVWDNYTKIVEWAFNDSALPGHITDLAEKFEDVLPLDPDDIQDYMDEAVDTATDKSIKKEITSALKDAKKGLKDFAKNMKDNKVTIEGTYSLTGGKGKRVAACEIEIKAKGDSSGSVSLQFTLTEDSKAELKEPGSLLDVIAILKKADIEEIMDLVDEIR